jgi:uncharacterized protein YjiS (DUF1127 family)
MTMEADMPVGNEFDLSFLDDLSRPWEQRQMMRDAIVRRAHAERNDAIGRALVRLLSAPWRTARFAYDAAHLVGGGCAAALAGWWRARAERRERRRGIAELEALSDRELWDIGLRRGEINSAVHHGRHRRPAPAPAKDLRPATPVSAHARLNAQHRADANETKRAA